MQEHVYKDKKLGSFFFYCVSLILYTSGLGLNRTFKLLKWPFTPNKIHSFLLKGLHRKQNLINCYLKLSLKHNIALPINILHYPYTDLNCFESIPNQNKNLFVIHMIRPEFVFSHSELSIYCLVRGELERKITY